MNFERMDPESVVWYVDQCGGFACVKQSGMVLGGHITDPAIFAMDIKTLHVVLLSLMVVQCKYMCWAIGLGFNMLVEFSCWVSFTIPW